MKPVFLEQFARIGKVLSSPSRLSLLDLLCQSEKSVETLVEQSGLELKNVSAQLRVMKEAGLVRSRKEGKYVYYVISDETVAEFWNKLQAFSSHRLAELRIAAKELIDERHTLEQVDRKTLFSRIKKGEVLVLDVRPSDEYQFAHLPFAISIPLEELKTKLKQIPKGKEIVAYCRGPYCLLAVEAVRLLRRSGFKAHRLDDGVQEWKSAGLPVEVG